MTEIEALQVPFVAVKVMLYLFPEKTGSEGMMTEIEALQVPFLAVKVSLRCCKSNVVSLCRETDGWQNHFTVAMNEQFDLYWAKAFTRSKFITLEAQRALRQTTVGWITSLLDNVTSMGTGITTVYCVQQR